MEELSLEVEFGEVYGVLLGLDATVDELGPDCKLFEFLLELLLSVALEVLEGLVAAPELGLAEFLDDLAFDWDFNYVWRGNEEVVGLCLLMGRIGMNAELHW